MAGGLALTRARPVVATRPSDLTYVALQVCRAYDPLGGFDQSLPFQNCANVLKLRADISLREAYVT